MWKGKRLGPNMSNVPHEQSMKSQTKPLCYFSYEASSSDKEEPNKCLFELKRIRQHPRRTATDGFLLGNDIHIR